MPLLILTYLVQLMLIMHVVRHGRATYWIWILLSAPVLGGLAYLLVEILPGSGAERKAARVGRDLVKAINPDMDLRKRAKELEICGSVDNKLRLAEECLARGMPEDALHLFESAASGPHASDTEVRYGIARAAFANEDYAKAADTLAWLRKEQPKYHTQEIDLLMARTLARQGQHEEAIRHLERLIPVYNGLEARFRHGEILRSTDHAAARQAFEAVLVHAKKFNIRHDDELYWVKQARKQLTELKAQTA